MHADDRHSLKTSLRELLANGALSHGMMAVAESLLFRCRDDTLGQIEVSQSRLARMASCSVATVKRATERLRGLGVLTWRRGRKVAHTVMGQITLLWKNIYRFQPADCLPEIATEKTGRFRKRDDSMDALGLTLPDVRVPLREAEPTLPRISVCPRAKEGAQEQEAPAPIPESVPEDAEVSTPEASRPASRTLTIRLEDMLTARYALTYAPEPSTRQVRADREALARVREGMARRLMAQTHNNYRAAPLSLVTSGE